jgi:hypothetical protein
VLVEAQDALNVRFGPGVDFPRVGTLEKGERFPVIRRHTLFEWVEIAFPRVAGGLGWVYLPAVRVIGNLNNVPATNITQFGYPTLTPTAQMVVTAAAPWQATPGAVIGAGLTGVSNNIFDLMLRNRFEPGTPRQGSAFVLDLQTGQSFSINPNVAYSGMSLIKIPVMVAYYRKTPTTPAADETRALAEMIVCSENLSSNAVLRAVGSGSEYRGAEYATDTLRRLGITQSFLVGPFFVGKVAGRPTPTVEPVSPPVTSADQRSTDPDPFNQTTPGDLGWLLSGVYQCALDGSGPLTATFPGQITMNECRQMVRLMRANRVAALIGGGLPRTVPLARKYGWVDEVHGDAAIVSTPGGDFVIVVMLRNKSWLNYDDSFPLIAEMSRQVYNFFNPAEPQADIDPESVPECSLDTIEPSLFTDLLAPELPPIR